MSTRRAWIPAVVVLAVVYLATLAPDVTFWDAGEFIAAAHSLGIPHPPGTPLFILLLHVWAMPLGNESYAVATNAFSALATVVAAGVSASLVAGWLSDRDAPNHGIAAGIAAAVCAGSMSSVWSNATETEVYAASLALAVLMLFVGDRAGRTGGDRWRWMLAYAFGLAAALHMSALVAAPAAIVLASQSADENGIDWRRAAILGAAALLAMALGTMSMMFAIAAAVVALVVALARREERPGLAASLALVVVGATPLFFMLLRARHDPWINQGNPSTWHALADVIARRQYDLAPLWPRRAPLWVQLANWFEYADWQTALSLAPSVVPTVQRIAVSVMFGALAIVGSRAHRAIDRRSWTALLTLFICGSIGVIAYLNLRASPSFGWGVLPADTMHEARERDYFFVLGFWTAGLWAGVGAVSIARRLRIPSVVGVAAAAVPIALNWSAVTRRPAVESALPHELARGLIGSLPDSTVLFVAGDNDSYPVWYVQEVLGLRRDVTVITMPLLGASWYPGEITRRHPELADLDGLGDPARGIANAARLANRPIAAALTLDRRESIRLNGCWRVIGLQVLDIHNLSNCQHYVLTGKEALTPIDTMRVKHWLGSSRSLAVDMIRPNIDPVFETFRRLIGCPRRMLVAARKSGPGVSVDSTCNP